jgi:transcriptional regulator with XRE-family HTH domain
MDFWQRLEWLLDQRGMTRKELAERVGLASSAVSVWKTRHTYPDAEVACRVASALNVTVEYLVLGIEASASTVSDHHQGLVRRFELPEESSELIALIEALMALSPSEISKYQAVLAVIRQS